MAMQYFFVALLFVTLSCNRDSRRHPKNQEECLAKVALYIHGRSETDYPHILPSRHKSIMGIAIQIVLESCRLEPLL